ncbi:MAG: glycosyltransferase involved in cell wall biosynthesis [Gammaproteobacteria bacterium]|jgi:glycosyltransferase involved in cell wall biosynthesis
MQVFVGHPGLSCVMSDSACSRVPKGRPHDASVLIFEPYATGHHLTFVKYVVTQLLEVGVAVTVAVPRGTRSQPEFEAQLAPFGDAIAIDDSWEMPQGSAGTLRGLRLLRCLRNAVRTKVYRHVYVLNGYEIVYFLSAIPMLRRVLLGDARLEIGLISTGLSAARGFRGAVVNFIKQVLIGNNAAVRLCIIDAHEHAWLRQHKTRIANRVGLIPDPIEHFPRRSRTTARERLGLPSSGRMIGCIGANLSQERKNTLAVLDAFMSANLPPEDSVLLCGTLGETVRQSLGGRHKVLVERGQVHSIDRYILEQELHDAIAASDVVCTPYLGRSIPSGIVVRAAMLNRPVLTGDSNWFKFMIQEFGLGWTVPAHSPAQLSQALEASLDRAHSFKFGKAKDALVTFSDQSNYGRHWVAPLRAQMGLPPVATLLPWPEDADRSSPLAPIENVLER